MSSFLRSTAAFRSRFFAICLAGSLVVTACGQPSGPGSDAGSGGSSQVGGSTSGGATSSGGTANVGGLLESGGAGTVGGAGIIGGATSGGSTSGGNNSGGGVSGGASGSGGAMPASWRDISYMLSVGCVSCHSVDPGVVLLSEDDVGGKNDKLFATLTTYQVEPCNGETLVVPFDSSKSAILKLLNMQCTKHDEPYHMPPSCGIPPCFPEEWMEAITLWIDAGAPR